MSGEMGHSLPGRFRLFLAVSVPEEIKDKIEQAQGELRRTAPEGRVRWAARQQLHLTLEFLGNVEAQRLEALSQAVRGAVRGFTPMRLRAEKIGFFPDSRFPRVVWVGVNDVTGQLVRLQRAVEEAVGDFTAEKPGARFAGHVTLGRIKDLKRPEAEALARVAAGMAGRFFGEWPAVEIELVRSELSPKGARYTCLAAVPLAGPQVAS